MGLLVNVPLPEIYLVRHGETEWSLSGRHTGLTDLPLTSKGEEQARRLRDRLKPISFAKVFRALFSVPRAPVSLPATDQSQNSIVILIEWNYGDYEGKKTNWILARRPRWLIFRDGCPNGESLADVGVQADHVIPRICQIDGNVLVFSSGHIIRVHIARWLGLEPSGGRYFKLGTATTTTITDA